MVYVGYQCIGLSIIVNMFTDVKHIHFFRLPPPLINVYGSVYLGFQIGSMEHYIYRATQNLQPFSKKMLLSIYSYKIVNGVSC